MPTDRVSNSESYTVALAKHVESILQTNPKIPLDIEGVCGQFNLTLLHKKIRQFRAYLAKEDFGGSDRYFILLPDSGKGSRYERFCIAHELAHYLLLTQFGTAIPSEINHWETEALCDEFARQVLVPDSLLRDRISYQSFAAYQALRTTDQLARLAGMPWIHAARRLQDYREELFFLRLQIGADKRLKVVASSLPKNKEIGRIVEKDSPWDTLIRGMTMDARYDVRILEQVDPGIIASAGIPSLMDAKNVALCVDIRGVKPDVRVAAVYN